MLVMKNLSLRAHHGQGRARTFFSVEIASPLVIVSSRAQSMLARMKWQTKRREDLAMTGYYVLSKTEDEQFVFTLYASHFEIALVSDPFRTKALALDEIEALQTHGTNAANYQRGTSGPGDPYFLIEDAEGDVIACSELHACNATMERAIQRVIKSASSKTIKDLTGSS